MFPLSLSVEPKTFKVYVERDLGRWCVRESSIPGLFLETDSWAEMKSCIEEFAPLLIVDNTDIQENQLSNVQILVFWKDSASCAPVTRNKPVILLESQLIA